MGLIPAGVSVLLFDPWSDKLLRRSWSLWQCLELLSLAGAMKLMACGQQHARQLHEAGRLDTLPVMKLVQADGQVLIGSDSEDKSLKG